MYSKILVPVDLAHLDRLHRALAAAADLAKHYGIPLCYVGVTASAPGAAGHSPQEFLDKLRAFGEAQHAEHGIATSVEAYTNPDPSAELDRTLLQAIEKTGSDLVVIASHRPGLPEHIFASNAGYLASHAKVSVFVVR